MRKILKNYAFAILELCIFSSVFIIALIAGIALLPMAFFIALVMAVKEVIKWSKKGANRKIPVRRIGSSAANTWFNQKISAVQRCKTYKRRVIYTR